ncbi:hypothetical protein [Desulfosporosinus sp. BG]|uniref:hypothetical protein n=1 Tax=Desulfosporosinus sp. BG TaxID=1633135 RepID=UPI00083A1CF2|nr:hypothetical protein [Desulfosporosinus sp. BG]
MYSLPHLANLYGIKIGSKADHEGARMVANALRDCIPPNIPLPFTGILKTTFTKGKRKTVKAVLEMFDGKHDTIQVTTWGLSTGAWSLQWILTKAGGSSFNWDGGKWIRIDESFWMGSEL